MLATILVIAVALIHFYFLYLEMVVWEDAKTRAIFKTEADFAAKSKVLAANQGLYNGFLAVGLLLGLLLGDSGNDLVIYMLLCVIAAGAFGAMTVSRRVFFVQALPAILALLAVWFA
jgi:putative membrane protein